MKHFKTLVRKYGNQVDFIMVINSTDPTLTADKVKEEFDVMVPAFLDRDKKIAKTCGVFSTPQAAILDVDGKLYYRGNYNKARYCTEKKSDFAQLAIDSLLANQERPVFNPLATTPYGCSLPGCKSGNNF